MANTLNSSTRGSDQASAAILLKSFTRDEWYSVSLDKRTCGCPQFVATLVPSISTRSASTVRHDHSSRELIRLFLKHYQLS